MTLVLRERVAAQLQWSGPGPTGIVRMRTRGGGYGPRPIDEAPLASHVEANFKNGLLEEGPTTLFADMVELGSTTAQTLNLSEMLEEVISSASGGAFLTGDVTSSVAPVESARVSFPHISQIEEPPIRFEDIRGKKYENVWLSAFAEEFDGLIDADAFRLVEVPKGANIVSGRWVNS